MRIVREMCGSLPDENYKDKKMNPALPKKMNYKREGAGIGI